MTGFGVLGYFMRKFKFEMAPLILALVLGPMMESNLRLTLLLNQGDLSVFVTKPISALFIAVSGLLILSTMIPSIRNRRSQFKEKLGEDDV
jgi:putative tricarboxylic transport membrane protein